MFKDNIEISLYLSECFELLSESNIIPKSLAKRFIKLAKFRNLLIHIYWEVDDKEVYKNVKENTKILTSL